MRSDHPTKKKDSGEVYERVVVLDCKTFLESLGNDRFAKSRQIEVRAKKLVGDYNRSLTQGKQKAYKIAPVIQFIVSFF